MPLDIGLTFPMTHEQAIKILVEAPWSDLELRVLRERCLATLHHNFGKALRDVWHLGQDTYPLSRYYQQRYGLSTGEDMSALLVLDFLARLKGEKIDLERTAERLKQQTP